MTSLMCVAAHHRRRSPAPPSPPPAPPPPLPPSPPPAPTGPFPITSLSVNGATFAKLNSSASDRDVLSTQLLLPEMQELFAQGGKFAIKIEEGDIVITGSFPDTHISKKCSHHIEAKNNKATGIVTNSSFFHFGVANVSWHGLSIFADAALVSSLDISTHVEVKTGVDIKPFGHCKKVASKDVGIHVLSDGNNAVGLNLTASNAHVAKVNGTWSLVFNFHAAVVGKVLTWNVDKVKANNCKIKILGIQIASVCGVIENEVKKHVQDLTDHVENIDAPKLLAKLENLINTQVGSVVVIPLRITTDFPVVV